MHVLDNIEYIMYIHINHIHLQLAIIYIYRLLLLIETVSEYLTLSDVIYLHYNGFLYGIIGMTCSALSDKDHVRIFTFNFQPLVICQLR